MNKYKKWRNRKMPKNPNENQENVKPQDIEFAEENTPMEPTPEGQKDARGGNHNPEGANQYTTGRHDDRGRKEDGNRKETKARGANQYTEGRNDDRGRKE
jgi:hypothetical protein